MSPQTFAVIYFFYGLAFFSMGLAIILETGHATDERLHRALLPLAGFGFIHGAHEWLEMFDLAGLLHGIGGSHQIWEAVRLMLLAFSFLSLAAFGAVLLAKDESERRLSFLAPLIMAALWGMGLLYLRGVYPLRDIFDVADVWTRYTLAVPAAVFACIGLLAQQRRFRQAGMAQFGRDALWAAIAFFWYGVIGQTFTRASALPPSDVINQGLFTQLFGFPVQIMRAAAAGVAALFVMRFMRAFEVERQNQISSLQAARLEEAERREALRGDLLRRVVEAQEAERQRLARELHDETGQALTAIGLGLRGASTSLNQDVEKAAHQIRQIEGLAAQSLDELRRLIADLRPSHLDDLGLAATLRWFGNEVQNRTGLEVSVEVTGDTRPLTAEMRTALFRIAQESMTNTVKHAKANHVDVRLIYNQTDVVLQVTDDGCGFDMTRTSESGRQPWGLEGMRERAALLGGEVHIISVPERGTLVEVYLPYPEDFNEEEVYENPIAAGG